MILRSGIEYYFSCKLQSTFLHYTLRHMREWREAKELIAEKKTSTAENENKRGECKLNDAALEEDIME